MFDFGLYTQVSDSGPLGPRFFFMLGGGGAGIYDLTVDRNKFSSPLEERSFY